MSTHSNIIIRVKEVDYNIVNEYINAHGNFNKEFNTVCDDSPYLEIYCHSDGHLVLKELTNYFNNYEDALQLVLNGDTSYIEDGCQYTYARKEGYENNCPLARQTPIRYEDYLYVFEDNKWNIVD